MKPVILLLPGVWFPGTAHKVSTIKISGSLHFISGGISVRDLVFLASEDPWVRESSYHLHPLLATSGALGESDNVVRSRGNEYAHARE